MNEQLQQALDQIMEKATASVDDGVKFLPEELPEAVHQLLVWKYTVSSLSMLAFFVLVCFIYQINKAQVNYWKRVFKEDSLVDHPEILVNCFQPLLAFPILKLWSIEWLQILLAPKVYLIEYAAQLAK